MAGGIEVKVEFPQIEEIKKAFRSMPPALAAQTEGKALKKVIDPGYKALLANVRAMNQVSGNLLRAVAVKRKGYKKTGSAVALAGFIVAESDRKASQKVQQKGRDKAYHQSFIEFGTKERRTKGRYASSFKKRGPFEIAKRVFSVSTRSVSRRIYTNPATPRAFFKVAKKGNTVPLGAMKPGGRTGKPPVRSAYESALPQMKALMPAEMTKAILGVNKSVAKMFPVKNNKQ
jgi:hypothetical protein